MPDHSVGQRLPRIRLQSASMMLLLFLIAAAPFASVPLQAEPAMAHGEVLGWVRDANQRGIPHASVQIGGHFLTTDDAGNIPPTTVPLNTLTEIVDVEVRALGFGLWRYSGVELSARHPVELHVELGREPVVFQPEAAISSQATPFDGPPDFINVGRTFSTSCVYPPTNVQRVDRMPFIDYVRNVLPYEWVTSWHDAALDAGAVAVSQFAWSTAIINRKWTRYGYTFDILDSTCDQVYKDRSPTANYSSTDAAVARIWGTALIRDNKLITTFYRDTDLSCTDRAKTNDCMGQKNSQQLALGGMSGLEILHYYYDPVTDIRTAPQYHGLLLHRSVDLTLAPGATATLSVCLRNAGMATWQSGVSDLVVVDPDDPMSTTFVSPFVHTSWRSPERPATLTQTNAATGQSGAWSFTVGAPAKLEPGFYQLAVEPRQPDGTALTKGPIVWNILVTSTTSYPHKVWLPLVHHRSTMSVSCS